MENYKGSVSLIAGLTQQDGGDFYLLNTDQIQADAEGTSLTDKLADMEGGSSAITSVGNYTLYNTVASSDDGLTGTYVCVGEFSTPLAQILSCQIKIIYGMGNESAEWIGYIAKANSATNATVYSVYKTSTATFGVKYKNENETCKIYVQTSLNQYWSVSLLAQFKNLRAKTLFEESFKATKSLVTQAVYTSATEPTAYKFYANTVYDGNGNTISETYATKAQLNAKQNSLTAGNGIDIKDGVISVKEGVIGEGYDDTDVRDLISANTGNITSLSSKVDALEQKPDKDTTYTAGKGVSISKANEISVNVSDLELPETYDDSALKARIKELEDKPDKDTVYDDTDVKKRLSDLEAKTDKDTTYSAGTAISISATNEISVDRDALNIPDITENTNAIAGHTTDIANLQKAVAEQTDLIAKYEATLDWIINEYDPSIESEVGNG